MTYKELRTEHTKVYAALNAILADNCAEGGFQYYPPMQDECLIADYDWVDQLPAMEAEIDAIEDFRSIPELYDFGAMLPIWEKLVLSAL